MARPKAIEDVPADVLAEAYAAVDMGEDASPVWRRLLEPYWPQGERTWRTYVQRRRQHRESEMIRDRMVVFGEIGRLASRDKELNDLQSLALGKAVQAGVSEDASSADVRNLCRMVQDLAELELAQNADRRAERESDAKVKRLQLLVTALGKEIEGGEEKFDAARARAIIREMYGLSG